MAYNTLPRATREEGTTGTARTVELNVHKGLVGGASLGKLTCVKLLLATKPTWLILAG